MWRCRLALIVRNQELEGAQAALHKRSLGKGINFCAGNRAWVGVGVQGKLTMGLIVDSLWKWGYSKSTRAKTAWVGMEWRRIAYTYHSQREGRWTPSNSAEREQTVLYKMEEEVSVDLWKNTSCILPTSFSGLFHRRRGGRGRSCRRKTWKENSHLYRSYCRLLKRVVRGLSNGLSNTFRSKRAVSRSLGPVWFVNGRFVSCLFCRNAYRMLLIQNGAHQRLLTSVILCLKGREWFRTRTGAKDWPKKGACRKV